MHGTMSVQEIVEDAQAHIACDGVLVTLLTHDKQLLLANSGLPTNCAEADAAPAGFSICRHAAENRAMLMVEDTRQHPVLRTNPGVTMAGIAAYLGLPIYVGREMTAAICAVHRQPRPWRPADVAVMENAADQAAHALMPDFAGASADLPVLRV